VRINHGGSYVAVAQELLNRPDIVIPLKQMAGKAVTEGVGRGPFRDLGPSHGPPYCFLDMAVMEVVPPPFLGFRNRDGLVLLAFSVMYSKDHGVEMILKGAPVRPPESCLVFFC
jgi:hypothetical protein